MLLYFLVLIVRLPGIQRFGSFREDKYLAAVAGVEVLMASR